MFDLTPANIFVANVYNINTTKNMQSLKIIIFYSFKMYFNNYLFLINFFILYNKTGFCK